MAVLLYYWLETARVWTTRDPGTLKAAAVILVLTLAFGVIHELRIYMPWSRACCSRVCLYTDPHSY